MPTVLLTDANQRKTLAAARSFGRAGWTVLVADDCRWPLTGFSRFAARTLRFPAHSAGTEELSEWLVRTANEQAVDLVVPMDQSTTEAAIRVAEQLADRVLVPTAEQFARVSNKGATVVLAQAAGVPTPSSTLVATLNEAEQAAKSTGYPVVVRARGEAGGRGLAFADRAADLPQAYAFATRFDHTPLVQRRIQPVAHWDVCLLYGRNGALCTSFVQRELRHFPHGYGSSTLQESAERPDLVQLAVQLLAPIGWRGVVEVEFLEDANGAIWLMEVNPRFWGSLALSIDAGVDFPQLLASAAAGKGINQPPYAVGLRARWMWPGDLLALLADPGRPALKPGFWTTNDGRTRDDTWDPTDPWPVAGVLAAALQYVVQPAAWKMVFRWG